MRDGETIYLDVKNVTRTMQLSPLYHKIIPLTGVTNGDGALLELLLDPILEVIDSVYQLISYRKRRVSR